jgi:hypothetical protein
MRLVGAFHIFVRAPDPVLNAKNCITPDLSLVTMGKAQWKKPVEEHYHITRTRLRS